MSRSSQWRRARLPVLLGGVLLAIGWPGIAMSLTEPVAPPAAAVANEASLEGSAPDPEESIPTGKPGSGHGALKDHELMAEREVFERDDGSAGEKGAKEGPETEDENHQSTPFAHVRRMHSCLLIADFCSHSYL